MITITYNNKKYEYESGTTLLDISKNFESEFKYPIIGAKVNGMSMSLNEKITENSLVCFFDITSSCGMRVYENTAIFILSKAVRDIMNKDVIVEHSLDKGLYCMVDGITEELIMKIKDRMLEIIKSKVVIEKLNINRLKMIKYYKDNNMIDKANLLKYISNTYVTIYRLDNIYDYFFGEMALDTSYVSSFNLKYLENNGFVLMLPSIYYEGKLDEYNHHDAFFKSIVENIRWTNSINARFFSDINRRLSKGEWNDLIFMSEATYNKALLDVACEIEKKGSVKMVLIAGPSCSGKTTTSKKLQMFLEGRGLKPVVLSLDDYFKERDETPLDENGFKDFESVNAIDGELFDKQMKEMLEYKEVCIPTFNFITGKKEYKKKIKLDKDSILIVEGLHSLNDDITKSIPKENKYKIYISPLTGINIDNHNRLRTTDNRLLRRMVRDNLTRGYTASQTLESWSRVRSGETKYVFPYQDSADVVLNTSLIYEISVLKVYAEPLLYSVSENDANYDSAIRLINILRMILPMPSSSIPLDSVLREFIGNSCFE